MTPAMLSCLADAEDHGGLWRVSLGWIRSGEVRLPVPVHSPTTVKGLVRRECLRIETCAGAGDRAQITDTGRHVLKRVQLLTAELKERDR